MRASAVTDWLGYKSTGKKSAATAVGRFAAGTIQTSKYGKKIVNALPHAKDFVDGAMLPGPPAMTKAGGFGYLANKVHDEIQKRKYKPSHNQALCGAGKSLDCVYTSFEE